MRLRWIAALAAAGGLAGCQSVQTTPAALSAGQVAAVQTAVVAVLKDPESARFGAIGAGSMANGSLLVCGYVNAKNSFGGYTGDSPYRGTLTAGRFQVQQMASDWGASPSNAVAIVSNCRADGIAI